VAEAAVPDAGEKGHLEVLADSVQECQEQKIHLFLSDAMKNHHLQNKKPTLLFKIENSRSFEHKFIEI